MEKKKKTEKTKNRLKELKDKLHKERENLYKIEDDSHDNDLKPLTPRQLIFIEEYNKTGNGAESAIKAGYAEKSSRVRAHTLLNMPHIKAHLKEIQEELQEEVLIQKIDIIKDLIEYNRKALDGTISENAGLKALEILNKMLGYYEPEKSEVTTNGLSINYVIPNENDKTK